MKKWFDNEDGATSVLIVFMMIVLVTLGAFALTSANVNIKFSRKAAAWSQIYYTLDAQGERYVQAVDAALANAEAQAADYIGKQGYAMAQYDGLPAETQAAAAKMWHAAETQESLQGIFALVYESLAVEALAALTATPPNAGTADWQGTGPGVSIDFAAADAPDYHLRVGLRIVAPGYDFTLVSGGVMLQRQPDAARYAVAEWYQWQVPQEYDDTQEVWDGQIH